MGAYAICSMCGRVWNPYSPYDMLYRNDYDMPLCRSCFQKLEEDKQHPIHKICEKRHRMFSDYIHYTYKKQEERTMDYNKKKDTSINVKRKVTKEENMTINKEENMTINSISDLEAGDKIRVIIGGEVYEAIVARTPNFGGLYINTPDLVAVIKVDKPLSKSWKELGYNSFEDMIDDIAKEHGSTGHKYAGEWVDEIYPGTFDGHLIADSYRDCIISIYDAKTDKHAIIDAPCATVYIPDKAKYFNNSFEDMIKEGRITSPSNYIKIHDAAHEGKTYVYADSFGKSIIRVINDDGSSTIYDADQFQVYLEEEDN